MRVVVEGVTVADLCVDAADGEVHLCKTPSGVVGLLAVDRNVAELAAVGFDELLAGDEHASRAAAGVVDAALVGREHLDQHAYHARWCVELAAALALGAGKAREEIFVNAAQRVFGAINPTLTPALSLRERERRCALSRKRARGGKCDVAHEVDDLAEPLFVETGAGEVLWQHALERGVVALDRAHRVIDQLADGRLRRHRLQIFPPRLRRHPKDTDGAILVRVFGVGAFCLLCVEFGVLGLEGVGDVLEKNQTKDDVLVFGRIHVVAQTVGHLPELGFKAKIGGGVVVLRCSFRHQTSLNFLLEVGHAEKTWAPEGNASRFCRITGCDCRTPPSP